MKDNDLSQRLQVFFDTKTKEELKHLHLVLCVANEMLAERVKEDKDE